MNSHPIEWAWLLLALGGLAFLSINALSARRDYLYKSDDGATKRAVWMAKVIYTGSIVQWIDMSLMAGMALWAIFNEPPPPPYFDVLQSFGTVVGCTLLTAIRVIQAYMGLRWRRRLGEAFD